MAKKVLLIISGILKSVMAGIILIIGAFSFLINGTLKSMYSETEDILYEFVDIMIGIDEKAYSFLLDYDVEQVLDFVMSFVSKVGIALIVLGAIILIFAILTFLIAKDKIELNKTTKIIFIIVMLIGTLVFSVSNILTIIALYLNGKNKNIINTSDDKLDNIPEYHIS